MGNILKIKIFKIEKDLKIIEAKNLIEQAEKNVNDFIKYKKSSIKSVSYTHLDVYKRQNVPWL